jgi:threonine dehydrogenase-like Zn-dependent dehydrogenase
MRALVNTGPGRLELLNWTMPSPGPGQVRIKTLVCGICSTDLMMIGGWDRTGYPSIPGHEWCGIIEAVGKNVNPDLVGHQCVAENVLADGGEIGFEHPGGYGEYLVTEARNIYLLPVDFPVEVGALIEPLAVCLHGLQRLRLEPKSPALVFGDGPIGLILLLLLQRAGFRQVTIVGGYPYRLALADTLGASLTIDFHSLGKDPVAGLRNLTGSAFSTIIEASGAAIGLQMAMNAAGHGAQILVMGDYAGDRASFSWNDLLHNELALIGSNASAGAWPEALQVATTNKLPLDRLVTHSFSIHQHNEGIQMGSAQRNACLKILLDWRQ